MRLSDGTNRNQQSYVIKEHLEQPLHVGWSTGVFRVELHGEPGLCGMDDSFVTLVVLVIEQFSPTVRDGLGVHSEPVVL